MKKISLLMLILLLAVSASGGYGYYEYVYNADDDEENPDDVVSSGGSEPIARITPSNPKIQINENISFSGADSTDSDNDELTYLWTFEDDSKQYEGISIERNYPDKGEFLVTLTVEDATGLLNETHTTVLVVEDYYDTDSGRVSGQNQEDEVSMPVDSGFISINIDYTLSQTYAWETDSSVTLRLTDADDVIVQEESNLASDGTWSYTSDDLSSIGDYVFLIIREEGTIDWTTTIDVKY